MGNGMCEVPNICSGLGKRTYTIDINNNINDKGITSPNNRKEEDNNLRIKLKEKENSSSPEEDALGITQCIDSYNPFNNLYFISARVTFIQKEFRKYLQRKKNKELKQKERLNQMKNNKNIKDNIKENIKENIKDINQPKDISPSNKNKKFRINSSLSKVPSTEENTSKAHISAPLSPQKKKSSLKFIPQTEIKELNSREIFEGYRDSSAMVNSLSNEEGNKSIKEPSKKESSSNNELSFYTNTISSLSEESIIKEEVRGNFLFKKKKYKFIGEVTDKKKDGFGKVIWDDGSILFANFNQNKVMGISRFIDASGTVFSGEYIKNIPNGFGIYEKNDGCFIGEWNSIYLNGIGIEKWDNGYFYQGEFLKFKKKGIGLYKWNDGTVYQGEWDNNKINGIGYLRFGDGRIYEGEFKDGKMEGIGYFEWNDGKIYVGNYSNDLRNGLGIYIQKRDPLFAYVGVWNKGKLNGIGIKITAGKIKYGLWRDGKIIQWIIGKWQIHNYLDTKNEKYEKFFNSSETQILKMIRKYI